MKHIESLWENSSEREEALAFWYWRMLQGGEGTDVPLQQSTEFRNARSAYKERVNGT